MTLLDRERLVTRTGLRLEVRAARGEDERALAAFFAKVTPEDMRFRFLSTLGTPGHDQLLALVEKPSADGESLIAWGEDGAIAATAVLAGDAAGERAEAAILLRGDLKGQGIGWTLLERLVAEARSRGYAVVESLEDRANHAALQVENDMGFDVAPVEDDPTLVWVSKRLR
nr:GNAT family N-acetyltransferase [uncultured Brevundimonas sp.]